uniref:hAT-like transposase RNase-H fold domain-containing protein n=2 Tax=Chenopodium quinoa TaxID=63459 RepID=A0A803LPP1_CHEQI
MRVRLLLKDEIESVDSFVRKMALRMWGKFEKYWSDFSPIMAIATIMDPRFKFQLLIMVPCVFSENLMDPKNAAEMLKHLEKQNELLDDAYKKMSHELHRLQVEEEMLMRKFYELTSALGLNKKSEVNRIAAIDAENDEPNTQADERHEQQ